MTYDAENIFAKILRGEIPSEKRYEDDHVLAFNDAFPAAPTHILVIPKGEYTSFEHFAQAADAATIAHFFRIVQQVAEEAGLSEEGYRISSNIGHNGSQTVPHFHVHILGGKQLGGLLPSDDKVR